MQFIVITYLNCVGQQNVNLTEKKRIITSFPVNKTRQSPLYLFLEEELLIDIIIHCGELTDEEDEYWHTNRRERES